MATPFTTMTVDSRRSLPTKGNRRPFGSRFELPPGAVVIDLEGEGGNRPSHKTPPPSYSAIDPKSMCKKSHPSRPQQSATQSSAGTVRAGDNAHTSTTYDAAPRNCPPGGSGGES
jgi:hypothetical protein